MVDGKTLWRAEQGLERAGGLKMRVFWQIYESPLFFIVLSHRINGGKHE